MLVFVMVVGGGLELSRGVLRLRPYRVLTIGERGHGVSFTAAPQ